MVYLLCDSYKEKKYCRFYYDKTNDCVLIRQRFAFVCCYHRVSTVYVVVVADKSGYFY